MSDYHEGDTFYSRLLLIEAIGGDGGDGGSALSEWVHWAHHHHHHLFVSPWPAGKLMVITVVITLFSILSLSHQSFTSLFVCALITVIFRAATVVSHLRRE